jgi:phosphate transport system ATP-binding protein
MHLNDEILRVVDLKAFFRGTPALHGINMSIPAKHSTAIIGPSGCGKSTLVRCLNRMHEVIPGATVHGQVWFDGSNIYGPGVEPVSLRRRIGMVFQRSAPFPTMSIEENVLAGLLFNDTRLSRSQRAQLVERSLKRAALWDDVKDKLRRPGLSLSGGQQQRLCIARALAIGPEILLMDEPCSALDPMSTAQIEQLIAELKVHHTIVLVTHNMQQAARASDYTAFLLNGHLIEVGKTNQIFTTPRRHETEEYITGRFG